MKYSNSFKDSKFANYSTQFFLSNHNLTIFKFLVSKIQKSSENLLLLLLQKIERVHLYKKNHFKEKNIILFWNFIANQYRNRVNNPLFMGDSSHHSWRNLVKKITVVVCSMPMLQCLNINDIISNHFWTASCQGHEKKNLGITFNQFFGNKCYTSNSILVLFSHLYLLSKMLMNFVEMLML